MESIYRSNLTAKTKVDQINTLEGLVEEICNRNNIFNSYFGNILMATSELFQIINKIDSSLQPEVYSYNEKGALVVGFKLEDLFLDVASLFQKDLISLIEEPKLNFSERCYVGVKLFSDQINLDPKKQTIELRFYSKSINSQQTRMRNQLIDDYFEGLKERKLSNKDV